MLWLLYFLHSLLSKYNWNVRNGRNRLWGLCVCVCVCAHPVWVDGELSLKVLVQLLALIHGVADLHVVLHANMAEPLATTTYQATVYSTIHRLELTQYSNSGKIAQTVMRNQGRSQDRLWRGVTTLVGGVSLPGVSECPPPDNFYKFRTK